MTVTYLCEIRLMFRKAEFQMCMRACVCIKFECIAITVSRKGRIPGVHLDSYMYVDSNGFLVCSHLSYYLDGNLVKLPNPSIV